MKKIIFLGIFIFLSKTYLNAQVKILFDASKAETAGNADWVIDADTWNIGYNPTPNTSGHEANAQQTPTPSQSGINSNTTENYWIGALSSWAVDLVKLGYTVESLPYDGQITYGNSSNPQDLSYYKVFIVCEPNILFTSAEKTALMNFIQNGGGLFMISDHDNSDRNGSGHDSPHIWNDFIQNNSVKNNPFGFTFDYEFFSETTSNVPNLPNDPFLHGNYGNVSEIAFYGGTSMTLNPANNSSVTAVVYRKGFSNTGTSGVLCAYATYGKGKVAAIGDSSPSDDGSGDTNDRLYDGWITDANGNHERLIINATLWLAGNYSDIKTEGKNKEIVKFYRQNDEYNLFIGNSSSLNGYTIYIYNALGQKVKVKSNLSSNQNYQINLKTNKIYFYRLTKQNKTIKKGKIL